MHPFLDLKMYHSTLRETNTLTVVHGSWREVSNSQFGHHPQSYATLQMALPLSSTCSQVSTPAHKLPHHWRRELFKSNTSNTQCSSHTRKNIALSSFPEQLMHIPLHTWELTIIWWVRLRGNMEGYRQTQCESSFNHSQWEKTGEVLSLEKPWRQHTQVTLNTVGQSGTYYEYGLDGDLGKYWYQRIAAHILYQNERNGNNWLVAVWEFSKWGEHVVYKGRLLHQFQWKIFYTLLTKEFKKHSATWTTLWKLFDKEINFQNTHIPTDFNGTAHKFMMMTLRKVCWIHALFQDTFRTDYQHSQTLPQP